MGRQRSGHRGSRRRPRLHWVESFANSVLARGFAVFAIAVTASLILSGCLPNDKRLIDDEFHTDLPGFSNIKVLKKQALPGAGQVSRVLTLRVTIDSYPDSVICEGDLTFYWGDPAELYMKWQTQQGTQQAALVSQARRALDSRWGRPPEFADSEVFLLNRWMNMGRIKLDDILYEDVRNKISTFP